MCLECQNSISFRGPPGAATLPDSLCSVPEMVAVHSCKARSAACTAASSSAALAVSDKSTSGSANLARPGEPESHCAKPQYGGFGASEMIRPSSWLAAATDDFDLENACKRNFRHALVSCCSVTMTAARNLRAASNRAL